MLWHNAFLWSRGLGFAAGAGLFWLQYFDLKDYLHPEPRRMLAIGYFLGALAAGAGLGLYWVVEAFGGPADPGNTTSAILIYCFLIVGPIEEGIKFLAARVFIFRSLDFDEPIDGLIYSSCISIGFASVESLIYTPLLTWPYHLARSLTAPLTHSLFASLWGFGTAFAFFRTRSAGSRFLWQMFSLIASMAIHGFYDFLLLSQRATIVAGSVCLLLWALLIGYARKVVRSRPVVSTIKSLQE